MKTEFCSYNDLFCTLAMEEFSRLGVSDVFIAPGSRSTPLVFAAEENPELKKHVHFDERGLSFMALGCAKKTGKPVVVITTSGTAAANLYPAIIEAGLTQVPLIICTGDRPFELRNSGANQSINQTEMFNHILEFYDLPCPSSQVPLESVLTTLDDAVYLATAQDGGPVHLNWMFQEPLAPPRDGKLSVTFSSLIGAWLSNSTAFSALVRGEVSSSLPVEVKTILRNAKNGLVIIGGRREGDITSSNLENLKWPIFIDVQNSLRFHDITGSIANWDLLLEVQNLKPDCVLWLGGAVTNRKGLEFFKNLKCPIIQVHPFAKRLDPHHLSKIRVLDSGVQALECLREAHRSQDLDLLLGLDSKISEFLDREFENSKILSEPEVAYEISKSLILENLFLASSRPIRDFQRFAKTTKNCCWRVFSNRGASGIDGNLATIAGLAMHSKTPTVGVVGDLAALHDINSLSLLAQSVTPIMLVIINNDGGGIFSFLPVSQATDKFEKYWGTPHGYEFEGFAKAFGLQYKKIKNKDELLTAFGDFKRSQIIEVRTDRNENFVFHQQIVEKLKKFLSK